MSEWPGIIVAFFAALGFTASVVMLIYTIESVVNWKNRLRRDIDENKYWVDELKVRTQALEAMIRCTDEAVTDLQYFTEIPDDYERPEEKENE